MTIINPLPPSTKSAYITNFEFVGTVDNSPYLCIPAAIRFRQSLGGEAAILSYCHELAKDAAALVAQMLGTEVLENSTGTLTNCCMSNVRLPLDWGVVQSVAEKHGVAKEDVGMLARNWMLKLLIDDYGTFMALMWYGGAWWVRLSAQVYLELEDFEWAARTLKEVCGRVEKGEFLILPSML